MGGTAQLVAEGAERLREAEALLAVSTTVNTTLEVPEAPASSAASSHACLAPIPPPSTATMAPPISSFPSPGITYPRS